MLTIPKWLLLPVIFALRPTIVIMGKKEEGSFETGVKTKRFHSDTVYRI